MTPLLGCWGWQPSKMPRAEEKTTVVWLFVIKILMIIPIAILAFKERDLYNLVKNHQELQQSPPYNKDVLLSRLLVYVGSMPIFPWCFISSAALLTFLRGPWIFWSGLVDFGLAVTIAVGVTQEARYLPASFNGCNPATAETWQVQGNSKSFFVQAAEFYPKKTPQDVCKDFVTAWSLAVGVLFFQLITAYIGIFFDEREHSILNPFRPFFYLILLIFGPPMYFWMHIMPRLRYASQFLVKSVRRATGWRKIKIAKQETYEPQYDKPIRIYNPKLQEILSIEHVLLDLVGHMHYDDVVNFSLSSRAIREAIFPGRDLELRVPKLKKHCCEEDSKMHCLYCNKWICMGCRVEKYLQSMPGFRHVTTCKLYCRKCYYQNFSRHQRGYKKPCRCHKSDRNLQFQHLCRACSQRDFAELQRTRTKRYEQQAKDIAEGKFLEPGESAKCGKCMADLKSGMRWWVCGLCQGECRDTIHPPYVGERKALDVEKGQMQAEVNEEKDRWRWRWKWPSILGPR